MKQFFVLLLVQCCMPAAMARHNIVVVMKDNAYGLTLKHGSLRFEVLVRTISSDKNGIISSPDGRHVISFIHDGYEKRTDTVLNPLLMKDTLEIPLDTEADELEEVVIQSTRTSRTINNTATRIETIDEEEIDEKANMRPGNVSMLLHESTGLQVQQTSATSANASIRVQGLDGRYTQLLKDGFPNFGNFASGLSILEIPPLDLKQVEVIKGPASTLYGGGAIAGVINFISKTPAKEGEYHFLFNQSNIGQTNIGLYASKRNNKVGYSILGALNWQKAYDADDDQFSELPLSNSVMLHPRLFFYPDEKTTIMIGNSFTKGENTGGDMQVIKGNADNDHVYFEKNNTIRNTATFELDRKFREEKRFVFKQSLSIFDRKIQLPGYRFSGLNTNSFTELSVILRQKSHVFNAGVNIIDDRFKQREVSVPVNQQAHSFTIGGYFQDTWDISSRIVMETGIRADRVRYSNNNFNKSQIFLLPRISTLFRISNKVSSRISGGLGYKTPTIFTEQTESLQYRNVLPLNEVTAEKSLGGTADVNLRLKINSDFILNLNQLFFHTSIRKPLVLSKNGAGNYFFSNASLPVQSSGFETNLKLIFKEHVKLLAGYTYTYAKATYLPADQFLSLVPENKINLALLFEKEKNIKLGLEGYFTGNQYLSDRSKTASYWEFGFMAEKTISKFSFYINFENFTDQRQSNYKRVVNPPDTNPTFDEIWNHTEGFVVNGGIKIKW